MYPNIYVSPCEILIQSTRLDNAEESHEHRRVFPSEEIGSSRTAWWWTSDAGIIQVGSHFSIEFVFGFYVGFGEICEKFYLSFCLLLPALIHFLRRKNNQQIAHLSCFFKLDVWLFCCRSSQDPPAPSEAGSDTADSQERYRFLLRDKHETVTSNPEKNRLKRNRDWWGLQID